MTKEQIPVEWLRFRHLKALGIVSNRQTLSRWLKDYAFPPGQMIGGNSRVWRRADVDAWMAAAGKTKAAS
jgi:predicted DNA-binding transcriptional regulator AlpA